MAIDTNKGDATPENMLRRAMDRAGDIAQRGLRAQPRNEEGPMEMTEADIVDRRASIRRVDIKVAMVSYIDSVFRSRTPQDGTIVGVSREQLLQELTELVVELDERAMQGTPPTNPMKPKILHGHGEPART